MKKEELNKLILKLDTSSDTAAEKTIQKILKFREAAVNDLMHAANISAAPRIRKWSLQALGAIGDKRAAPLLVAALKDERMTVRLHAVKGLSRMKYKKAAKAVALLLKDESGGVRVNALYALIEFNDSSVLSQIQKSLSDIQWYVRQNACLACAKLGGVKAKKKISELAISDERKAVREAAREALNLLNLK